jgi:hypothetical protein
MIDVARQQLPEARLDVFRAWLDSCTSFEHLLNPFLLVEQTQAKTTRTVVVDDDIVRPSPPKAAVLTADDRSSTPEEQEEEIRPRFTNGDLPCYGTGEQPIGEFRWVRK